VWFIVKLGAVGCAVQHSNRHTMVGAWRAAAGPNSETAVAELNRQDYVIGGYPSIAKLWRRYRFTIPTDKCRSSRRCRCRSITLWGQRHGKVYAIGGQTTESANRTSGICRHYEIRSAAE